MWSAAITFATWVAGGEVDVEWVGCTAQVDTARVLNGRLLRRGGRDGARLTFALGAESTTKVSQSLQFTVSMPTDAELPRGADVSDAGALRGGAGGRCIGVQTKVAQDTARTSSRFFNEGGLLEPFVSCAMFRPPSAPEIGRAHV